MRVLTLIAAAHGADRHRFLSPSWRPTDPGESTGQSQRTQRWDTVATTVAEVGREWAERGGKLFFVRLDRTPQLAGAIANGARRGVFTPGREPVEHRFFDVGLLGRNQMAAIELAAHFDP